MGRDGAAGEAVLHEQQIKFAGSVKASVGILRRVITEPMPEIPSSHRDNNVGRLAHTVP